MKAISRIIPVVRLPFILGYVPDLVAAAALAIASGCGGSLADGSSSGGGGASGGTATGGTAAGGAATGGSSATVLATGGVGGDASNCSGVRVTPSEATTLYTAYAFSIQPDLNPATVFDLDELRVDGLWGDLHAQLFDAKGLADDGTVWRRCTVLYRECHFVLATDRCGLAEGPLDSGLVANGAFYYSWGAGSGIYRSRVGKLAEVGGALVRSVSAAYYEALVLENTDVGIAVLGAQAFAFNEWSLARPLGMLLDDGDRLTIVDAAGHEVPPDDS